MAQKLLEGLKVINGTAPSSDMYNSDPASDVVLFENYDRIVFLIHQKTAGSNTGKATVTVESCDDTTPTTATAIAFTYYKNESAATSDDFGAGQSATTAGFSTTANKTAIYAIEVKAADVGEAGVRLQLTEATDDPVIGSVLILAGGGRYEGDPNTLPTAIA